MSASIVNRLNQAKKDKKITLAQLSEQSGISLGTVYKIMSGALKTINPDKLAKLAKVLEVDVDYLLKGTKNKIMPYLGLVSIACISPSLRVADCPYNTQQIVKEAQKAYEKGIKIALFPELSITGYSCGDLFFQKTLRDAALEGLQYIMQNTSELDMVLAVGMPIICDKGKMYNAAVILHKGNVLGVIPKTNLPNYNEFFEKRIFAAPNNENNTIRLFGKDVPFGTRLLFVDDMHTDIRFAVEICEDVWVSDSPSNTHARAGANIVLNLSTSNDTINKGDYRRDMIKMQSGKNNIIYAYCSSGPDESTSDTVCGGHNIICEYGQVLAECKPFTTYYAQAEADVNFIENERAKTPHGALPPGYTTVHFDMQVGSTTRCYNPMPFVPSNPTELAERCESALNILAHGLKKRIAHTNVKTLVIGVSGGTDSTLALCICAKALALLGRPNTDIVSVTMPCFGTTQRTLNNSIALAKALGTTVRKIDITKAVTQHLKDIGHDLKTHDVTYENAQARERTQVLMDIANATNGLVIGTGDMSELALGWATYNGDHMSMYGVNSSVPKTFVKALLNHIARNSPAEVGKVILDVLDTPVSPELLPPTKQGKINQVTEDLVGPYELHDYFLYMLVRKGFTPQKVYYLAKISFAQKYSHHEIYKWMRKFLWRFFSQQFKRSCTPDGVKLGSVDLSKHGFHIPSDAVSQVWIDQLAKTYEEDCQ